MRGLPRRPSGGQLRVAAVPSRVFAVLAFLLLPALSSLSPLLVLPALTSRIGAQTWASVALSQSLGSAAAVIVELGWGLNGPQRVRRMSRKGQIQVLWASLASRGLVAAAAVLLSIGTTLLLVKTSPGAMSLIAVGTTLSGMSLNWFFIGARAPFWILLTDAIPRVVFVVVGALLVRAGAPLFVYALSILVPSILLPLVGAAMWGVRPRHLTLFSARRVFQLIRAQSTAMSGRVLSALYIALPIAIVGVFAPQALAVFAAAEKLERMVLQVLQFLPNSLQGWIGAAADPAARLGRAWSGLRLLAVVGILCGVVYAFLAPVAAAYIFSHGVALPLDLACVSAGVIAVVSVSRATGGLVLVARRQLHFVAISAGVGAVVGFPAIAVGAKLFGPIGGFWGELLAESAVLAVQCVPLFRKRVSPSLVAAASSD